MNFLNIFEERISAIFDATPQGYTAPFSFKKLAKRAAREMEGETFLIDGVNTAPGLYTILVSQEDDAVMRPLYASLTDEISQFIEGQANKKGYVFVGKPLVRFMVDPSLKSGRFSVFAENVDARTLMRLREEEAAFIGGIARVGGAQAPIAEAPAASVQAGASQADRRAAVKGRPRTITPLATPVQAISPEDSAMQGLDVIPASSDLDLSASAAPVPIMQQPYPQPGRAIPAAAAAGAAAAADEPRTMLRPQAAPTPLVDARRQAAAQPAPAPVPEPARCTLIDTQSGRTYVAQAPETLIGRERNSGGIVLRDPNVSRRHARLSYDGSTWHITDLNSTNGTLVNDMDITTAPLTTGDVITIGLVNLTFREG